LARSAPSPPGAAIGLLSLMSTDIEQQLSMVAERSRRAAAAPKNAAATASSGGSAASPSLPGTITRTIRQRQQQQQPPPASNAMAAAPGSSNDSWQIGQPHAAMPAGVVSAAPASAGPADGSSSSSSTSIPSTVVGRMGQIAGSSTGSGTGSSSRSSAGKSGPLPAASFGPDPGATAGQRDIPPLSLSLSLSHHLRAPDGGLDEAPPPAGPWGTLEPIAEEPTASPALGSVTSSGLWGRPQLQGEHCRLVSSSRVALVTASFPVSWGAVG
jgi:hypothetical protein